MPPDSSEIFIDTIDGVVVAVESFADVQTIVPQVSFHRLETQILGNDIWYDPEAMRQMRAREREYLDGAIFVSARQESAAAARPFVDAYPQPFPLSPHYAAPASDATPLLGGGRAPGACKRRRVGTRVADVDAEILLRMPPFPSPSLPGFCRGAAAAGPRAVRDSVSLDNGSAGWESCAGKNTAAARSCSATASSTASGTGS